jgi:AcrR family transcriptional regulator
MTDREKAKTARRNLIVDAAIACFIKKGIHQTGIRDIAEQANVSLGNLYNHFSGKDALIAEIALLDGEGVARFAEALHDSKDPMDAIRTFIDGYLDHVSDADNAALTVDIIGEALRNPPITKQFEANRNIIASALCATIERGITQGTMRQQIQTDETAALILDAVEGLGLRAGLAAVKPSSSARKTLQEMVFRMLAPQAG